MLIIGRNPILEALEYNSSSIRKIIINLNATDKKINEIIRIANVKQIAIEKLDKNKFDKLFDEKNKSEGISQGILAEIEDFVYTPLKQLLISTKVKPFSTLIILDEIQDPHNLGAIIRSAAASAVDGIILTEKNTAKVNHTVIKTSSGAANHIKITQVSSIYSTFDELKKDGYFIIGTSLNAENDIYMFKFPPKSAIVFGNEGEGLRKNVQKICDDLVNIPILNKKIDSLNVSVAAGVILYEILRQKRD